MVDDHAALRTSLISSIVVKDNSLMFGAPSATLAGNWVTAKDCVALFVN